MIRERLKTMRKQLAKAERVLWSYVGTAHEDDPKWGKGSPGEEAYQNVYDAIDTLDGLLDRQRKGAA